MKKSKSRDFDPESLLDPAPSSSDDEDSIFSGADDVAAGREHYEDVGKSRLRKKEVVPLGPQYTGSKISRDAVEDEDSDDPFSRPFNIEDSDDESGIETQNTANGNGAAYSEEGDEGEGGSSMEEDEDDEDEDQAEEDADDSEGSASDQSDANDADQTSKLREMMKDTSLVTSTISQAAQSDVEKGKAIQDQRKTFDTLLNSRIRLQKALISTNSMASGAYRDAIAPDAAIEAAEKAALTLLTNITDLRSSLDEERIGTKRKRQTPLTTSTRSAEIWSHIKSAEADVQPHRNAVLEKWSTKTRGATLSSSKGRLNDNAQQTLTDVLSAQLQDSTRLVARTQVPRSCAPLQSAANIPSSEDVYDDADFYGLLLKELLENRSASINSASEFIVEAPWQIAREAKTRKVVDTKASKGRKLRYTVHEKLQNFMAPEDRSTWVERQRDDLFSSLFGRRVGLGEDDEVMSDEDDVAAEEEGLTLFRS